MSMHRIRRSTRLTTDRTLQAVSRRTRTIRDSAEAGLTTLEYTVLGAALFAAVVAIGAALTGVLNDYMSRIG